MAKADHFRAYDANGNVFHEGAVAADGVVSFQAQGEVSHIVFYSGAGDAEVCEGSCDIKQSGTVSVNAQQPAVEPPVTPVVVTANAPKATTPPTVAAVVTGKSGKSPGS